MAILIFWLLLCFVAAVIANNKGRSAVGFFFLAFFLSPLIGIIFALVAQPNRQSVEAQQIEAGESKKCRFCAEVIRKEALVCRYCGKDQQIQLQAYEDPFEKWQREQKAKVSGPASNA